MNQHHQLIPLDHPSNPRLLREARRRKLNVIESDEMDGRFSVSSHSRRNHYHSVFVCADGYSCGCEATGACSHGAIASAEFYPVACGLRWSEKLWAAHREQIKQIHAGALSPQKLAAIKRKAARAACVPSVVLGGEVAELSCPF